MACYKEIEGKNEEIKSNDPRGEQQTIDIISAFIQSRCYDLIEDKKYNKTLQVNY